MHQFQINFLIIEFFIEIHDLRNFLSASQKRPREMLKIAQFICIRISMQIQVNLTNLTQPI